VYSTVVARHVLTQRSRGQRSRSDGYENRHGRMVASDARCYGRVLLLPACSGWPCPATLSIYPSALLKTNCFYRAYTTSDAKLFLSINKTSQHLAVFLLERGQAKNKQRWRIS